jgi:hypothetical protein
MVILESNVYGSEFTQRKQAPFMADIEATMIIRAWAEPAQNHGVRARLISSRPGQDREIVETAGDADEILQAVQRWLDLLESSESTASA